MQGSDPIIYALLQGSKPMGQNANTLPILMGLGAQTQAIGQMGDKSPVSPMGLVSSGVPLGLRSPNGR